MGMAGAQQQPAPLTLTLTLVLLLQKHAIHAATMRFFCPVCGGKGRFRSQMTTLGIQIPTRLVSFRPVLHSLRHRRCACPQTAPAGPVPCHPASIGLIFTEQLGMSSRGIEPGGPGSASRLGHRGLITFPLFSGRRPSWWDDAAYQSLRERHRRCDASMCFYLGGRERAQEKG